MAGDTTLSIGHTTSGISNRYASICQAIDTSSGSRVRRDGTIPISSSPYPWRPVFPRPISTCVTVSHQPLPFQSIIPDGCRMARRPAGPGPPRPAASTPTATAWQGMPDPAFSAGWQPGAADSRGGWDWCQSGGRVAFSYRRARRPCLPAVHGDLCHPGKGSLAAEGHGPRSR